MIPNKESSLTKRQFLKHVGAAGLLSSMSGCLGGSSSSQGESGDTPSTSEAGPDELSSTTQSSSSVFEEIQFEGTTLVASLASPDGVSEVNVIRGGEAVGDASVSAGASQVELMEIEETLRGDELQLVAVDDAGEEIASVTESFTADASVTRVRSVATKEGNPVETETMQENQTAFERAVVTVENTGSAPLLVPTRDLGNAQMSYVFLTSGVPTPWPPSELDRDAQEPVLMPIPPEESRDLTVIYNGLGPFLFKINRKDEWPTEVREMGDAEAFPEGYGDGDEVDVNVVVEDEGGNTIEETVSVTYSEGVHEVDSFSGEFVPGRVDSAE